jgi:hypothetical protein
MSRRKTGKKEGRTERGVSRKEGIDGREGRCGGGGCENYPYCYFLAVLTFSDRNSFLLYCSFPADPVLTFLPQFVV